ncbi:MAG: PilZ domain-containing protein [Planctomycetota bacterium]|nr:PilZ domain-containing protein [Planctomycetota bacterium]
MTPQATGTDPLRTFLSGKRRHKRHPVSLAIEVSGRRHQFPGRCLDVSVGGALIAIPEYHLDRAIGASTDGYLSVLDRELNDGFDVSFLHNGVVVEARLIRLSMGAGQGSMLKIGCEFVEPLTGHQLAQLGVEAMLADGAPAAVEAAWQEAAPAKRLPFEPKPGMHAAVLLFDESPTVCGPRFSGHIVAMGARTLGVRIDGVDPQQVTSRLGTEAFRFHVVASGGAIWEASATVVAARYLDRPDGGAEIALLADTTPNRKTKRLFRKRKR